MILVEWPSVLVVPATAHFVRPCDLCVRTEHRERGEPTLKPMVESVCGESVRTNQLI
jgi:hypothetical protein